ncbi:MAG: hypothetical protein R6U68_02690 [Desulfobacteraceae bacterium]
MGEAITVNGYEIALSDGTFKIIVMSVVFGAEEIVLRDSETGAPLWRGTKGFLQVCLCDINILGNIEWFFFIY